MFQSKLFLYFCPPQSMTSNSVLLMPLSTQSCRLITSAVFLMPLSTQSCHLITSAVFLSSFPSPGEHPCFHSTHRQSSHWTLLLYKALSVCLSVPPFFRHDRRTATKFSTHIRIDRYGTGSHLKKLTHPTPGGGIT